MALLIDAVPEDIAKLRGALEALLEGHRNVRSQFAAAALATDEVALQAIRERLAKADTAIEAAYACFRDAIQRFGGEVCAAVRSLQVSEELA
jgi:hypothetical protein